MIAENNFNRALREAVSSELSDAILHEAKNPHTFSDDFLRKMDKLTKAEQSRFWRMTSTVPKRIAVIMASLLIITLTACSIPSVRAAVVGFIKETYDNCIRLFTGGVGSNNISDQCRWSAPTWKDARPRTPATAPAATIPPFPQALLQIPRYAR